MRFLELIGDIFNVFIKASAIRENGDTRQKSVIFAITSIVYSLVAFGFAFAGAFLFTIEVNILTIFIIIIAVVLLIGAVVALIGALLRLIAQFTINRNAMSWIALIIFIAAIASSIIVIAKYIA